MTSPTQPNIDVNPNTKCRYSCGKLLYFDPALRGQGVPLREVDTDEQHSFKRCAELQKQQGKKPYFFDEAQRRARKKLQKNASA